MTLAERLRLARTLLRPPLLAVCGLFLLAGAGTAPLPWPWPRLLLGGVALAAYVTAAVAANDVADRRVDAVNLAGDPDRPLVSGTMTPRGMAAVAGLGAVVAVGAAAALGALALCATAAGCAYALAYSHPRLRLSARGAVAGLTLPLGYVLVPFLLGAAVAEAPVGGRTAALAAALYVGFVARIVLKDFRDAAGDALYGKRTFLVRHGRRRTCQVSAAAGTAAAALTTVVPGATPASVLTTGALTAGALVLTARLGASTSPSLDGRLVPAIAACYRGGVVVVVAVLQARATGLSSGTSAALVVGCGGLLLTHAWELANGQRTTRSYVPPAWQEDRSRL